MTKPKGERADVVSGARSIMAIEAALMTQHGLDLAYKAIISNPIPFVLKLKTPSISRIGL